MKLLVRFREQETGQKYSRFVNEETTYSITPQKETKHKYSKFTNFD